jgi:hypothetical protein
VDAAGVPMRHPRPLTAAELHLELEKEQEAVVCVFKYNLCDTGLGIYYVWTIELTAARSTA